MVKLIFVLRRKPDMTREAFQKYWYEKHAPLVRSHAELLGIRRYVQQHTIDTPLSEALAVGRGQDPYDGVAELHFDSVESLTETMSGEAAQRASAELAADEARFIDLDRSPIWLADERPIVER